MRSTLATRSDETIDADDRSTPARQDACGRAPAGRGRGPGRATSHVAIVGSGFAGLGMAIRLKQRGHRRLRRARARRRRRRHLARQHLPRLPVRRARRTSTRSRSRRTRSGSRTFSRPAGDPGLPAPLRRRRSASRPHVRFGHEVTGAAWDDEAAAVAHRHRRAARSPRGCSWRRRARSASPRSRRSPASSDFEGTVFHTAHWDHDARPDRRARRRHRHRRLGHPGRAAASSRRCGGCTSSSARRRGSCPTPTAPISPLERRALPVRCRPRSASCARGIYWARETFVLGFRHRAPDAAAAAHRAPAPALAGRRPRAARAG